MPLATFPARSSVHLPNKQRSLSILSWFLTTVITQSFFLSVYSFRMSTQENSKGKGGEKRKRDSTEQSNPILGSASQLTASAVTPQGSGQLANLKNDTGELSNDRLAQEDGSPYESETWCRV